MLDHLVPGQVGGQLYLVDDRDMVGPSQLQLLQVVYVEVRHTDRPVRVCACTSTMTFALHCMYLLTVMQINNGCSEPSHNNNIIIIIIITSPVAIYFSVVMR